MLLNDKNFLKINSKLFSAYKICITNIQKNQIYKNEKLLQKYQRYTKVKNINKNKKYTKIKNIQGVSEIRVLILTSGRTRQFMKLFSITFWKIRTYFRYTLYKNKKIYKNKKYS
jgi:hypothetical protein